jgi:hypothetical protein
MKICPDCNRKENETEFIKGRSRCKDCHNAHKRKTEKLSNKEYKRRRRQDPELYAKMLSQNSKWRYGIDHEERDKMLAKQGGVCAVCGSNEPKGRGWVVDHDHSCCPGIKSCGECIRGILCVNCNLVLGHANDNIDTLTSAIAYLLSDKNMLMASLGAGGQPQLSAGISRRLPI